MWCHYYGSLHKIRWMQRKKVWGRGTKGWYSLPWMPQEKENEWQIGDGEKGVFMNLEYPCPILHNPSIWSLWFHPWPIQCVPTQEQAMLLGHKVNHSSPMSSHFSQNKSQSLYNDLPFPTWSVPPLGSSNPWGTFPPQGFCTCCFLFLERSSPKYLQGLFLGPQFPPEYSHLWS